MKALFHFFIDGDWVDRLLGAIVIACVLSVCALFCALPWLLREDAREREALHADGCTVVGSHTVMWLMPMRSGNPLAEFACKPGRFDTHVVRVRGLTNIRGGLWAASETTDPGSSKWLSHKPGDKPRMFSRELCTVEDAERQVKERIEKNAAQFAANAKLDRIVDTLQAQDVEARRALGGVLVRDTAALGRLFARLP